MPPKRAASTSKRKASPDDTDNEAPAVPKRAKASSASVARYSDQPTNKVLPVTISFPPKAENTLRFSTWNIAGLAASQKKVRNSIITIPLSMYDNPDDHSTGI